MPPTIRPPGPSRGMQTSGRRGPLRDGDRPQANPDAVSAEMRDLALDLVQLGLDLAGIVDPTPVSDGASAVMALARGNWLDAVISGASMIPYVGDLAKAGKLPRYLRSVQRAVELVEQSADAARQLMPGLRKLSELLELVPKGSNRYIDEMRQRVDDVVQRFSASAATTTRRLLPDVSNRFNFPPRYRVTVGDKAYQVQEASGPLGVPGLVRKHRDRSAQTTVSGGSGDHAGHLIGNQFGAPGGTENLTRQNWIMNTGGGSFYDLEKQWKDKLVEGTGIEVKVRDFIPEGSTRPAFRKVEWTEIAPDGTRTTHQLDFANTHSADWTTKSGKPRSGSRTQQGIEPTVSEPQSGNVIDVDFQTGQRKP